MVRTSFSEELLGLLVAGGFFLGDFGHRLMLRVRIWTSETNARLLAGGWLYWR
jgi:hypothetical protein